MTRPAARVTVGLLIAGPIVMNVAFLGLGAAFDYPAILRRPAAEVLDAVRTDASSIVAWFALLAIGAALLAPIAILVGRLSDRRAMKLSVPVGISAAAVQMVGLLRWPLLVPALADRAANTADGGSSLAAITDFELANRLLGTVLGETLGYALTAGWTVLVVFALGRRFAGAWFVALGLTAGILIALGALTPLGIPGVDSANFIGYVLWSAWLMSFAFVLARRLRTVHGSRVSNRDGMVRPQHAARG